MTHKTCTLFYIKIIKHRVLNSFKKKNLLRHIIIMVFDFLKIVLLFNDYAHRSLIENHFGNAGDFISSPNEKKNATWKLIFSSKIHERITLTGNAIDAYRNSYSIYSNYIWITLSSRSNLLNITHVTIYFYWPRPYKRTSATIINANVLKNETKNWINKI